MVAFIWGAIYKLFTKRGYCHLRIVAVLTMPATWHCMLRSFLVGIFHNTAKIRCARSAGSSGKASLKEIVDD